MNENLKMFLEWLKSRVRLVQTVLLIGFALYVFVRIRSTLKNTSTPIPPLQAQQVNVRLSKRSSVAGVQFSNAFSLPPEMESAEIFSIQAKDGFLWIASSRGLLKFRPTSTADSYEATLYRPFGDYVFQWVKELYPTKNGFLARVLVAQSNAGGTNAGYFEFFPTTGQWAVVDEAHPSSPPLIQNDSAHLHQLGWADTDLPHDTLGRSLVTDANYIDQTEIWNAPSSYIVPGTPLGPGMRSVGGHSEFGVPRVWSKHQHQWASIDRSNNGEPLRCALSVNLPNGLWLGTGNDNAPLIKLDRKTRQAKAFHDIPHLYWPSAIGYFEGTTWVAAGKNSYNDSGINTKMTSDTFLFKVLE